MPKHSPSHSNNIFSLPYTNLIISLSLSLPFSNSFMQKYLSKYLPFQFLPNISAPKMKNRASAFLKQVLTAVVTVVKAKSLAVKSKTSAIKTRLFIFGLLRNRKLLVSAISHKIHALTGKEKEEDGAPSDEDYSKAIVMYNVARNEAPQESAHTEMADYYEDEDEDGYPDLTHSLFNMEDEDEGDDDGLGDGTGSVVDLVKNSREDGAADFRLEEEIDYVADVFIRRFHKQMKMQKQESFKRYKDMMERSV